MTITQNGVLKKDDNDYPVMGGTSSVDNATIINSAFDPVTRRLLTDFSGGSGTVTSITAGTGLTATPANPIVASGTIALDSKLAPLDTLGTGLQQIRVNAGATALEYFTAGAGSGTITKVGNVTTGASFDGTAGITLTSLTTTANTFSILAGQPAGATDTGNTIAITASNGGASSGNGGSVNVTSGNGVGFGTVGGQVYFKSGSGAGLSKSFGILFSDNANTNNIFVGNTQTNNLGNPGVFSGGANAYFDTSALSQGRLFAFPDAAGTFALASQLTSGTVTTVSVATANGFSGTVANATTTPAITISTSITGVLKGNGTAISAATAGSDYAVGSIGLSGGQTIAGSTLTTENLTLRANAADTTTGSVIITTSTASTTTSTGALTVAGGLGVIGRVSAGTFNGNTITAGTAILTGSASKTLTWSDSTTLATNAITLGGGEVITFSASNALSLLSSGTTVMTFPAVTDTVAVLGTAQTYTATMTEKQVVWTNNAITASGNAATVPITSRLNTVTNNSAATLTITMTTTSAVDGQLSMVRILDATGVAQTVTWVNTENSTVTAPTTSNGSTTLFLTVGFIYNGGTSKWRCVATA